MNICHYLRLNVCVYRLFEIFLLMDTFLFLFSRGLPPPFGSSRYFVDILSSVGYDELAHVRFYPVLPSLLLSLFAQLYLLRNLLLIPRVWGTFVVFNLLWPIF